MSSICRLCLAGGGNVALCPIKNVQLTEFYEKLTYSQFHAADGRPRVVCCFCYQRLLRCWTLSEMAHKSENILNKLLFKGLEATHETIERLKLRTKQHLSLSPMLSMDLNNATRNNSYPITIKEEPLTVKEEETLQDDELVDTESIHTPLPERCIKNQHYEDSSCDHLIKHSTKKDGGSMNSETKTVGRCKDVDKKGDNSRNFSCDFCSKLFLSQKLLVSHKQLSHSKEQQCKILNVKSDIIFKTNIVRTEVELINCSICNKLLQKRHLTRHMKIHEESHVCMNCDKTCRSKCDLLRHMRVHTGEKPYACSLCDLKCSLKLNLQRHMLTHTGEMPYMCNVCGKQCTELSNLKMHMRIHSGQRPYSCNTCDKKFYRKSCLVKHMRTHTGETPYPCSICQKKFKFKYNLLTHMRAHDGIKRYACSICNKKFTRNYNLKCHMNIHSAVV